jgi:alkylation response protein AidB-like acyl-CoA dehydrogenase
MSRRRTSRPADELLGLGKQHLAVRDRVADVLDAYPDPSELLPPPERYRLLRSICSDLGRAGILGGIVGTADGGAGMSYTEMAAAVEEAAAHAQVVASLLAFASAGVGTALAKFGTAVQRERYLRPMLQGETLAAMGFTEPEGGSDVASMSTVALAVDGGFTLDGEKVWVDWSPEADWFLIFAQANPEAGRKGISAFVVEGNAAGVRTDSMGRKLGFREYSTGRIKFKGCRLSEDALLGSVGDGMEVARGALEDARVFVASRLCGCLQVCLQQLQAHAESTGVTREDEMYLATVADAAISLDCARFQTYRAASIKDAGMDASRQAMEAKLFASEALGRLSSEVVRLLGVEALDDLHPAARLFRDAKVSGVTAGSDEIMRTSVARLVL